MTSSDTPAPGLLGPLADHSRPFSAGEVLFTEGQPAKEVFLLSAGRVRLLKRVGAEERGLCTLKPGELCGEAALIPGACHVATAVAIDPGSALAFDRPTLAQSLAGDPALCARVLQQLARRLQDGEDQVEVLMVRDPRARVILALLRLAEQSLPAGVTNGQVSLELTPLDLAARTGLDVPAVKRSVQEIQDAGYVTVHEEHLELTDLPALRDRLGLYEQEDRIARPVWSGLAPRGQG